MTEIQVNQHSTLLVHGSFDRRRVLAHMKVEDKSNEITAIPALLELLSCCGI